ncbi:MAG: putative DNA-binding domain-containing protein, partial [Myxococcales bacterium]|nr:putative DNA-binding domain-containing protein [Myxococcales bacterium]
MAEPTKSADTIVIDAFAAALRERAAGQAIRRDLAGFYAAHGLEGAALAAMVERGPERLRMYRTMVQARLRRVIREWLPRTVQRVNKALFRQTFAAFMEERAPRTRYLRCVPAEFALFAAPRWRARDDVPAYLVDFMRHELIAEDLRIAPVGGELLTGHPMALDRPMRADSSASVLRYDHAVHLLAKNEEDDAVPEARECWVLAYRDRASHRVRFLELTQRAAAVVRRLLAGEPVQ